MNHTSARSVLVSIPLVVAVVAASARAQPAPRESPQARYARLFVGFDDEHYIRLDIQGYGSYATGVASPVTIAAPYRGARREWLDVADFYDAVDRPDLASGARRRHAIRIAGLVVSVGSLAASVYFVVRMVGVKTDSSRCDRLDDPQQIVDCNFAAEHDSESRGITYFLESLGAAAGAGIGLGVYGFLDENPVGDGERHQLARDHNQRLKRELGLPDDFQLTPYAQPGGAGMALTGRF